MIDRGSISAWLEPLVAGDDDAVRVIWDRYRSQLLAVARKKLGDRMAGAGLPLFKKQDLPYRKVCLEVRKELESLADHLRKDLVG